MAIKIWLHIGDRNRLTSVLKDVKLVNHKDKYNSEDFNILTGKLKYRRNLAPLKESFVLGEIGIAKLKGSRIKSPFVHIEDNSRYPKGFLLAHYYFKEFEYHLDGGTVDLKKIKKLEMRGSSTEDFVHTAFFENSFYLDDGKRAEKDEHLILYAYHPLADKFQFY
jgi:hypothetical protein